MENNRIRTCLEFASELALASRRHNVTRDRCVLHLAEVLQALVLHAAQRVANFAARAIGNHHQTRRSTVQRYELKTTRSQI